MLISDVLTAVRAVTGHDVDTQFSDATQLLPVLAQGYRRLRRWLCVHAPNLCEQSLAVVLTGTNVILKSALTDFERIRKIERMQANGSYYPIIVHDELNSNQSRDLCAHEQPLQFVLMPTSAAPGSYLVTWVSGAPATIATTTTLDLPAGLEDVLINWGAAWVSVRHEVNRGDAAYFTKAADDILKEQKRLLMNRYGVMSSPGMVLSR